MNSIVSSQPFHVSGLTLDRNDMCPACGDSHGTPFLAAPDRFHGRSSIYELVSCPLCSMVWLKDPPLPTEMSQHYGEDYDKAIARAGEDRNHWRSRRQTLLRYKTRGALLDLGCSSGGFLSSIEAPSWNLCGIEMSERAARTAEAKCGAQVFVGNILDAPFPPRFFDAITCFHVLEHLYQPKEVLSKVFEWLKPGGIFYLMVPNIHSAGARIFRSYWYPLELPRHLSHFSPTSLGKLGKSVGLTEVSITTHREVFIEASARYILAEALHRLGWALLPPAKAKAPSLPWRMARKAFRLTVLPALSVLASLAGDGESIHAIFEKRPQRET